jgi:PQQ-dependent dehydrogenase (methanol/ethanol family)
MRSLVTGLVGATLAAAASSAMAQAGNEWLHYGGDQSNTRYSSLSQINTGNVKNLRVAWMHSLGSLESQESTPLVVGDTMYVTTSTGPKYVFALDAKTGKTKWKHEPEMPNDYFATVCCGLDNRGVAYANGKVFFGRLDAKLVALDAKTGEELWTATVADYKTGHAITSPPVVYKNLVVTGIAGGEYGIRGFVEAYDQNTGKSVWKTYTIPGPGEPGNDLARSWKTSAGSTAQELRCRRTSCTGPAMPRGAPQQRLSDILPYTNLWTPSQLAPDSDTGKSCATGTPSDVELDASTRACWRIASWASSRR